jgi:pyruvate-ferredoxin/flavodoxin oxidoreductase
MLARSNPEAARELLKLAQDDVNRQWRVYANRAAMPGAGMPPSKSAGESAPDAGKPEKEGQR